MGAVDDAARPTIQHFIQKANFGFTSDLIDEFETQKVQISSQDQLHGTNHSFLA